MGHGFRLNALGVAGALLFAATVARAGPPAAAPPAATPTPASVSVAAAPTATVGAAPVGAAAPIGTAPISAGPVGPTPAPAGRDANAGEDGWTAGKLWSLGGLAGLYTGVGVWAYFAWYQGKPSHSWRWNGDGLFGRNTYAGGSDKLGHFWSNHVVTRATTELLMAGGWRQLPASLIASGLCATAFTLVEVKDAYYYEFSAGDLAADLAGVGLGLLMMNAPAVDRLIDVRIAYWPTDEYIDGFKDGDVNFAEDYSGQTYLLALHLSGIPGLTDSGWTRWGRYVDLVGGFQSVNYKPEPEDPMAKPRQELFFGAALNLQALLEDLYGQPAERGRARTSHRILHSVFEFVSLPYTTLRMAEAERHKEMK